jgi:putative MATE family efflux protein
MFFPVHSVIIKVYQHIRMFQEKRLPMEKTVSQEAHYKQMTETPVSRLVIRLAIPAIIGMTISSVYNMADTFFVSQINISASGAVGIVFSIMAIIQAIGFALGMGSGSLVSRHLGARENKMADIVASVGFFSALAIGTLVAIGGSVFQEELVHFLGATETISGYARSYARYILLAAPIMCATYQMNNVLRSEGKAALGTFAISTGGILNIILDPIFIFGFHLEIAGAAIATALSQCVSFSILLCIFLSGRSSIRLSIWHLHGHMNLLRSIAIIGFPTLCRQGLASLASVVTNRAVRPYGDAAIAAMSIISRIIHFQGSVVRGLSQGCQPVAGFNYGARKYLRVYDSTLFTVRAGTIFMLAVSVAFFIGAPDVMHLFCKGNAEVISVGTLALRAYCLVTPLTALVATSSMVLQSIGKPGQSTLLSCCRQGLFLLPFLLLLPSKIGLLGVQLAQPLADALTFCVALPIYLHFNKTLLKLEQDPF